MSHEEQIRSILAEQFEKLQNNLENLRSMLQDLVLAVPSPPDPQRLAAAISEVMPEPEPAPPPEPPAQQAAVSFPLNNSLLYRMGSIEYAESQGEILNHLSKGIEDFAERGVLFVVRGDTAQAWNSFGFDGEEVRGWKVQVDRDPILQTVAASRTRMLLDRTLPAFIPVSGPVRRSLISPLLLKGKMLAFVYADSGEAGKLDHYSVDILVRTASLVIDIFPLKAKRDPLPPTLESQEIILPGQEPAAKASEEAFLFEDSGTLAAEPSSEDLPGNQTLLAEIPREAMAEPSAKAEVEPEEVVEEATIVEEVPGAPEVESTVPTPELEPAPPAVSPGDEKIHEDAKRFARLLVQEIALYHPKEVDQGKRTKNLYSLLREDIDRSREAYDHRFQQPSVQAQDYFGKALVNYLADGDTGLMGT